MIGADADLQQNAHQLHLVADRFEEELLEDVARFVELGGVESGDAVEEARVILELHVGRCLLSLHTMLRGLMVIVLLLANLALWGIPVLLLGMLRQLLDLLR